MTQFATNNEWALKWIPRFKPNTNGEIEEVDLQEFTQDAADTFVNKNDPTTGGGQSLALYTESFSFTAFLSLRYTPVAVPPYSANGIFKIRVFTSEGMYRPVYALNGKKITISSPATWLKAEVDYWVGASTPGTGGDIFYGIPEYDPNTPYQYGVEPKILQAVVDGNRSLVTLKNTPNTQDLETRLAPSLAPNSQWRVEQIGVNGNLTAIEIRNSLQTLTGDDRLDASAIKNLPGTNLEYSDYDGEITGFNNIRNGITQEEGTGEMSTLRQRLIQTEEGDVTTHHVGGGALITRTSPEKATVILETEIDDLVNGTGSQVKIQLGSSLPSHPIPDFPIGNGLRFLVRDASSGQESNMEIRLDGLYLNNESIKTSSSQVWNETPIGNINGSNALFHSAYPFNPSKFKLYVNGLLQKIVTDYQLFNNQDIQLTFSPQTGEDLKINYEKL
ncbi:hypothetical protein AHMF7605_10395 [Adhaeribacter arboris]|uniref:Uncharacterized protein n=1 Tax=Adhaeribacter arboris TaxID=2072846 RepID=A0A2T2YEF6_9BACT|nr:hypothetical protein [Adhaeribacter arboris]PSR53897.1 hypothetical protein AHMF7605_10395 [Adhaeribacter arboris]